MHAIRRFSEAWKVYLEPAALHMLALGFSAGLPLLLVLGTLGFWLREAGIDRTTIGYLSWVGLAYAAKWAWAPLVDRLPIPILTRLLGRRRSWLLCSQGLIVAGLFAMSWSDPRTTLPTLVWSALLVAFGSATQDVVIDAFRIESADTDRQAALAATYQAGYRLAMIWAGAGTLWLAAYFQDAATAGYQHTAWRLAYQTMALTMLIGVGTVLWSREPSTIPPPRRVGPARWLRETLIEPFADFLHRHRWHAALILALIATYRISDIVLGIMANPFYVDMGFGKSEVATVTKVYGTAMTLAGAFLGGVLVLRWGMFPVLLLGAASSAASNLLFAWLAGKGADVHGLILVVSADNLAGGLASAAFVAYLSGLTAVQFCATQYALLSSIMLLLPKFVAGYSGHVVDLFGYPVFFVGTALLGVPVLGLLWLAARAQGKP
ncbi:AmpG family muropeptide MFS transporter [Candidatus Symbiobacter mobilis]|nr:MFS transporter [Candidatus Symbiobacter mobilis]